MVATFYLPSARATLSLNVNFSLWVCDMDLEGIFHNFFLMDQQIIRCCTKLQMDQISQGGTASNHKISATECIQEALT
jgi:hypothetical protein